MTRTNESTSSTGTKPRHGKPTSGSKKKEQDDAGRRERLEFLNTLAEKIEGKLGGEEMKASVSDWIRLLQLRKELEEEQLKELEVTWVDGYETESVTRT
jgi:hypothetical protein